MATSSEFESLRDAFAQARLAQQSWQSVSIGERARIVARVAAKIVEQRKTLASAIRFPMRSGYAETLSAELLPLADTSRWLGRNAKSVLASRTLAKSGAPMWLGAIRARVDRVPRGLVLIVGTWNYPLFLAGSQLLHALVAGNAIAIKPAPGCEEVTEKLVSLVIDCGVPKELIVLLESSIQAGQAAMAVGVDHVVMTGSSNSGRRIIEQSSSKLTSTTLELSGCDSVFVLPSADLDRVADLMRFGLRLNGGSTCIAPRRVFVPDGVHDALVAKLLGRLQDPVQRDWRTSITPDTMSKLQQAVAEATSLGAKLLVPWERGGGEPHPSDQGSGQDGSSGGPRWVSTGQIVVAGIRPEMRLYSMEVFAPLLMLVGVRDLSQAIDWNRKCPYALGATIFGRGKDAQELAKSITCGVVSINDLVVPTADPRLPFGGRGESGFGVTRGVEGLLDMTVPRAISERKGNWLPHKELPQEGDEQILDGLLQFQHGKDWWARLAGLRTIFGNLQTRTRKK